MSSGTRATSTTVVYGLYGSSSGIPATSATARAHTGVSTSRHDR